MNKKNVQFRRLSKFMIHHLHLHIKSNMKRFQMNKNLKQMLNYQERNFKKSLF